MWNITFQSGVIAIYPLTKYLGDLNRKLNEYHKVFATGATVNVLVNDWVVPNFMDASKKALYGLPTVKMTKSTELLHKVYKNVPVLPEENYKLLKYVKLSEHIRKFYQNALLRQGRRRSRQQYC
ncbi:hypothetical protein PR048_013456, partial [Dryococelus australis]